VTVAQRRQPLAASGRAYRLLVEPTGGIGYSLRLEQARSFETSVVDIRVVGRASSTVVAACLDQVLDALRRAGHRSTELRPGSARVFELPEDAAVRIGLLFLALRPLSKTTRMEQVAEGIRRMAPEEAFYWFSKCATPTSTDARRAQHALRVLLAPE
jgi:hypothetical protein